MRLMVRVIESRRTGRFFFTGAGGAAGVDFAAFGFSSAQRAR